MSSVELFSEDLLQSAEGLLNIRETQVQQSVPVFVTAEADTAGVGEILGPGHAARPGRLSPMAGRQPAAAHANVACPPAHDLSHHQPPVLHPGIPAALPPLLIRWNCRRGCVVQCPMKISETFW